MLPLNENLDTRAFWELWVPEPAVLTRVLAREAEQWEIGHLTSGSNLDLWVALLALEQVLPVARLFAALSRPAPQRDPFAAPMP